MSTANPYRIEGPALISFSGGRTSAFMLHEILRAHDGALPADVHVVFANTGKEREETLRFVHECGERWNVRVHWVERLPAEPGFVEVGYNSASRQGEPFAQLIAEKGYLPNAVTRFCTSELKVRAMRDFMKSLGYRNWVNVVGLRYDEGMRVMRGAERNDSGKDPWQSIWPLSWARVTKRDVLAFWEQQPFDLGLYGIEGNCDLCFLKRKGGLLSLIRNDPVRAAWWIEQEARIKGGKPSGARFVTEYSYRSLADLVRDQGTFFDVLDEANDEYDAECGLTCGAAA